MTALSFSVVSFYNSNLLAQNLHEERREWQIKGLSQAPFSRIMQGLMVQIADKQWRYLFVWPSRLLATGELEFWQESYRR